MHSVEGALRAFPPFDSTSALVPTATMACATLATLLFLDANPAAAILPGVLSGFVAWRLHKYSVQ